ncbi:MAG: DNA ligase [Nitriliruptor sp.]|nr:MAG: DNA ligase [Nitriliruptor sp.]
MAMTDELEQYRTRRDLEASPEPAGEVRDATERPVFVIQQHDASSLHYDVRLEADGVLLSWAVPKGPSTDPRDKQLAVRTEDHPVDDADFEGRIPEGEYGAGTVIVWDIGPYRNLTTDDDGEELPVGCAVEQGHVKVWLEGEKLRGGYALTHAKLGGDESNWLLVKIDDEAADARRNPTSTEPYSVLSDRTIEEVAAEAAEAAEGDGRLRHPRHLGLREDEEPQHVVRETPD